MASPLQPLSTHTQPHTGQWDSTHHWPGPAGPAGCACTGVCECACMVGGECACMSVCVHGGCAHERSECMSRWAGECTRECVGEWV